MNCHSDRSAKQLWSVADNGNYCATPSSNAWLCACLVRMKSWVFFPSLFYWQQEVTLAKLGLWYFRIINSTTHLHVFATAYSFNPDYKEMQKLMWNNNKDRHARYFTLYILLCSSYTLWFKLNNTTLAYCSCKFVPNSYGSTDPPHTVGACKQSHTQPHSVLPVNFDFSSTVLVMLLQAITFHCCSWRKNEITFDRFIMEAF